MSYAGAWFETCPERGSNGDIMCLLAEHRSEYVITL